MDADTAAERLALFGEVTIAPVVTAGEQTILLQMSVTVDKYGLWPTDDGWEETYNPNIAISQAWLLKASRLAPNYLFMSGGRMFSRQQFYEHCIKQYRIYSMKSGIRAQRLGGPPEGLDRIQSNS